MCLVVVPAQTVVLLAGGLLVVHGCLEGGRWPLAGLDACAGRGDSWPRARARCRAALHADPFSQKSLELVVITQNVKVRNHCTEHSTAVDGRLAAAGGRSVCLSVWCVVSRDRVTRTCYADGSRARSELSDERGTPLSTRFAPRPVRGECECEWRGRRGPALSPALRTHARDHTHTPHTYTHTRHTSTPSHVTPTLHYVFFRVPTLAIYVEKSRQIPFRLEDRVKCQVSSVLLVCLQCCVDTSDV